MSSIANRKEVTRLQNQVQTVQRWIDIISFDDADNNKLNAKKHKLRANMLEMLSDLEIRIINKQEEYEDERAFERTESGRL